MCEKICLFAGTAEGRRLAAYLNESAELTVCVATEYGETALHGIDGLNVRAGRMDRCEMERFIAENRFTLILDATHPYAEAVTENIRAAAAACGVRLIRVLREDDGHIAGAVYVPDAQAACGYLMHTDGNILIATGAKELDAYAGLDMSRVYVRVLPAVSSLLACGSAGILASHIIAAQGPFSEESNLALLHAVSAKYLVTKDSGRSGGFMEKISAAKAAGVVPVIIGRPSQSEGLSFAETLCELGKTVKIPRRKVYIIGVGVGDASLLTLEARSILQSCDAVCGAERVIGTVSGYGKPVFCGILPEQIKAYMDSVPEFRTFAAVMRGDTGFYSGAKKLIQALDGYDVTLIPGISSPAYFAAKLKISWENAKLISLHGRKANLIRAVDTHRLVFALTGGEHTAGAVCAKLCEYGFSHVLVSVGERLSYPDEKITRGTARDFAGRQFDPLSILLIENASAAEWIPHGIPDAGFLRAEVPMTKSEVRTVVLSRLALHADSVVWDIGAGTGSVSVECALAAYAGCVYAVEKNAAAVDLIEKNARRFKADNLIAVAGEAPAALEALPAPTHVFIGGSSGHLREILALLLRRNPKVRVVLSAATLETQAEALSCAEELGFIRFEAVQISASRAKKLGGYHMMSAQNPVVVITMEGGAADHA